MSIKQITNDSLNTCIIDKIDKTLNANYSYVKMLSTILLFEYITQIKLDLEVLIDVVPIIILFRVK